MKIKKPKPIYHNFEALIIGTDGFCYMLPIRYSSKFLLQKNRRFWYNATTKQLRKSYNDGFFNIWVSLSPDKYYYSSTIIAEFFQALNRCKRFTGEIVPAEQYHAIRTHPDVIESENRSA